MREATYTPCECETGANNGGWQIKSPRMVYKEDQHEIVARDATFRVFGKPVMWTPYMSMPDGEVKQQSGFLTPDFGFPQQSRRGHYRTLLLGSRARSRRHSRLDDLDGKSTSRGGRIPPAV